MINIKVISYFITVLFISGLMMLASGCGGSFTGSSIIETKEMDYSDFSKLEVSSAFEIDITRGDTYFVSITANDNLFQNIDIRQEGKTLYIGLKQPRLYLRTTQKAAVVLPDLDRLKLSGASRGEITDFDLQHLAEFEVSGASLLNINDIKTADAKFDISGASEVFGIIETADCTLDVSGASTVELEGSGVNVSIEASGASKLRLFDFPVQDVTVELSGASNASINSSGRLDADLSGASELSYRGSPTMGSIKVSDASKLSQR